MSKWGMNLQYQELENTFQYSSYKNTKQPSEQRPPREIEQMQDSSSKASPTSELFGSMLFSQQDTKPSVIVCTMYRIWEERWL